MISLLEKTDRALAADGLRMGARASSLLEWDAVTAQIAGHCRNRRAVEVVRGRRPFVDLATISLFHRLADELRLAGEQGEWPPLVDVCEMLDLIQQPAPVRLEGPDLVHIATVAAELDNLRDYFLSARQRYPEWSAAAETMVSLADLSGAVKRALDPDGRIVDGASALLARLRRAVSGQEQAVRQEVGRAMARARQQGWTTGEEATLRGDRFCLPLRSGDVRRIEGIVHDRSASGATLFVEPAGVVRLANDLAATRLEIAAEETRILFALIRLVEERREALDEGARLMLLLDTVRAPMRWSRQVRGVRPHLSEQGELRICGGGHPLLLSALGGGDLVKGCEEVVPLDLDLPASARVLVISGPNAGGKSVALKTVAVFCLLGQCGWDVPASEGTVLPLIDRLLADLGDDQSIAASLSSFSAHLSHLAEFMVEADSGTLVVCDEIGSGTDPQEGTALAFAVLSVLANRGARVLASTHFGLLKAAVHDHHLMVNAAMDYDETDLKPLFTFRVGDPGTSHAFDIAARMGFPEELLERARQMAGEERVQVERLLSDLDRRSRDLSVAEKQASQEARRSARLNEELEQRLKGLKREVGEAARAARREAEEVVREGRRLIEKAVRDIRTTSAAKDAIKSARSVIARLDEKTRETSPEPVAPVTVVVGERVRIPHLGLIGRVVEVRGNKLVALADGMRLNLTTESVAHLDTAKASTETNSRAVGIGDWSFSGTDESVAPEIDLRGEIGEDGWERLDKFIDRAIPAGLEVVYVIHGFGTGRLRDHLHRCLRGDPRVREFREAEPGRGGGGATRVVL